MTPTGAVLAYLDFLEAKLNSAAVKSCESEYSPESPCSNGSCPFYDVCPLTCKAKWHSINTKDHGGKENS